MASEGARSGDSWCAEAQRIPSGDAALPGRPLAIDIAQRVSVTSSRHRSRAALELGGLVLGVEYLLWGELLPGFAVLRFVALVAIAALLWSSHLRRRSGESSESSPRPAAVRTYGLALLVTLAAAAIVMSLSWTAGWWAGSAPHFDVAALASWGDLRWWAGKAGAVIVQQLLLQYWVLPLCCELDERRAPALVLAGCIFGAVHLPNPVLSLLTAAAAPAWCALWLYGGRLLPIVASHLLLAILVRGACGDAIYSMRVGASVLPLLPRTLLAPDGGELRVMPRAIEGYVDQCRVRRDQVSCSGWTADVDRRRPADAVTVLAAGSWHRFPISGEPRPDVASAFRMPELERSGFELELPLAWFRDEAPPRFFGVAAGKAAELEYLTELPSP